MIWLFMWRKYSGTKRSSLATAVSFVGMCVALFVGLAILIPAMDGNLSGVASLLIAVGAIAAFIGIKILFRIWTDKIANSK